MPVDVLILKQQSRPTQACVCEHAHADTDTDIRPHPAPRQPRACKSHLLGSDGGVVRRVLWSRGEVGRTHGRILLSSPRFSLTCVAHVHSASLRTRMCLRIQCTLVCMYVLYALCNGPCAHPSHSLIVKTETTKPIKCSHHLKTQTRRCKRARTHVHACVHIYEGPGELCWWHGQAGSRAQTHGPCVASGASAVTSPDTCNKPCPRYNPCARMYVCDFVSHMTCMHIRATVNLHHI
jgi:hypothetical protein